jgi:hypothetical protein
MPRILIAGATGVMGRRLVALGRRLLPHVEVLGGSRRGREGARALDVRDAASVRSAVAGVGVVINAVGPFEYDPEPLLAGCVGAGCHYVDLAETPAFIAAVQHAARDVHAARAGVCVLSGCSTVPGLVQVLAQRWAGREDVRRVRVLLSMGSANPVSATLLYSLLRPLGTRAPNGSRYFSRLVRKDFCGTSSRLYGLYPSAFDRDGLRLGRRTVPATFHAGMDRSAYALVLWLAAKALPWLPDGYLWALCRGVQPVMPPVRRLGGTLGILALEAYAEGDRLLETVEVRAHREGLNVPALPAVWAARRLLEPAADVPRGPLGLDQLFTPQQAATWLAEEGYEVLTFLSRGGVAL